MLIPSSSKKEDSIFFLINKIDQNLNVHVTKKLESLFGNSSLSKLKFTVDKKQGFIILYYDILNSKESEKGNKSMISDYNREYEKTKTNPHLITTSYYYDENSSYFNGVKVTTLQKSKIEALILFVNSY